MKKESIKTKPRKTTHLPNCLLRIKGRRDSKRGNVVVKAYVNHLVHKADSIVSKEYKLLETYLSEIRVNAANALREYKSFVGVDLDSDNSVAMNLRHNKTKSLKVIVEAFESINHYHAVFDERVHFIRSYNDSKIVQYTSVISEEIKYEYSEKAANDYFNNHKVVDEAIKKVVEKVLKEENSDV